MLNHEKSLLLTILCVYALCDLIVTGCFCTCTAITIKVREWLLKSLIRFVVFEFKRTRNNMAWEPHVPQNYKFCMYSFFQKASCQSTWILNGMEINLYLLEFVLKVFWGGHGLVSPSITHTWLDWDSLSLDHCAVHKPTLLDSIIKGLGLGQ